MYSFALSTVLRFPQFCTLHSFQIDLAHLWTDFQYFKGVNNKEYGEDVLEEENEVEIEIPEKEIAENEEGLLNKMKTDEERLSDHI